MPLLDSAELAYRRTGNMYGAFAFSSVILSCFAGYFFYSPRYFTGPEMVPVTFGLGGLYAALGILCSEYLETRKSRAVYAVYYLVQCTLLTALIFLSPLRGIFGIIVLPIMSQAIFDLRPMMATLIGIYLFTINIDG